MSRAELSRGEVPIYELVEPGVDVIRTAVLVIEVVGVLPDVAESCGHPAARRGGSSRARSAGSGSLSRTRSSACRAGSVWTAAVLPVAQSRHGDAELRLGKPELPANVPHF